MVYANPRAFRFAFGLDFWKPVCEKAPTVMSAKFSGKGFLREAVAAVFAQISPETATTCRIPSVGPQPAFALMKALAEKDSKQAKAVPKISPGP
ncbi:MAG: hypothetical protein QF619_11015 [Candidatus Binatia bacterium]|jgi:hypothetical protein|nr:hypothetical protein [Candidatus Binatia bacterium]|tara:strand:+ start:276 stop:557 length:282 start_codon:yes stop_codon:yes gene_type:complete